MATLQIRRTLDPGFQSSAINPNANNLCAVFAFLRPWNRRQLWCCASPAKRATSRGSPPPFAPTSGLHRALRTRVDGVERCRAADVEPVSLHAAEAQVCDRFRNVDLAQEIAAWRVAAHTVLVRVAPAHGAPDTPLGVGAHPVGDAGLGHFRKDLAVR